MCVCVCSLGGHHLPLLLWSGQACRLTRPPARPLTCSPIPIHQIPRTWELAPGPRIHPAHQAPPRQPKVPTSIYRARTWGASAPSLLAPFPSHLHLVPLQSSAPSVTRQDPRLARAATISYLLPVRVWSSNSHATLIPSVMATPSTGAVPPPKQIRFVNNQGQPPSKRRRVNAASVHILRTLTSTSSRPLRCVICAPVCETLFRRRSATATRAVVFTSKANRPADLSICPTDVLPAENERHGATERSPPARRATRMATSVLDTPNRMTRSGQTR